MTDWDGNPVKKPKEPGSYSYDSFVTYQTSKDYDDAHYSDRLSQWNREKYNELCVKHFGKAGDYWGGRSPKSIEAFLREYWDSPGLELVGIMECCNKSSGYPYWAFMTKGKIKQIGEA